jgi:uncharacterized membrane protein
MPLQLVMTMQNIALMIILAGILLIILGFLLSSRRAEGGETSVRRTRAIVFIGPIPLVWGFSRRTQVFLALIAIMIFAVFLFLTF